MYNLVNPSFTIEKWGSRGLKLYRCVFVVVELPSPKVYPFHLSKLFYSILGPVVKNLTKLLANMTVKFQS